MSGPARAHYLPVGLPIPVSEPDGLSAPYWEALRQGRLLVQRCDRCGTWQFGPEWICHHCHAFDLTWTEVEPAGRIFEPPNARFAKTIAKAPRSDDRHTDRITRDVVC